MKEVWKPIIGYEGLYEVSNKGRVKSLSRKVTGGAKGYFRLAPETIRKPFLTNGYEKVDLWKDNKKKIFRVHRLVAQAFIENPNNYLEINHINGIKTDNRVENLEWCTAQQNTLHYYRQLKK